MARDRPLAISADVEILGQFRERGRPLLGTQVLAKEQVLMEPNGAAHLAPLPIEPTQGTIRLGETRILLDPFRERFLGGRIVVINQGSNRSLQKDRSCGGPRTLVR